MFLVLAVGNQKPKNENKNRRNKTSVTQNQVETPEIQVNPSSFDDIYKDVKNPASYSSNVRAFMNQKRSLSIHKKRIKNFQRRPIIVPGPYHSISADLVEY